MSSSKLIRWGGLLILVAGVSAATVGCTSVAMQQVELQAKPSPGKALVKFHRPPLLEMALGRFTIWDGEHLVGASANGTTVQYECDPGRHLFIVAAYPAKCSAVRAELKADGVYHIVAAPVPESLHRFPFIVQLDMTPVTEGSRWAELMPQLEGAFRPMAMDADGSAAYEAKHLPKIRRMIEDCNKGLWVGRLVEFPWLALP